jgi:hypothetical protein
VPSGTRHSRQIKEDNHPTDLHLGARGTLEPPPLLGRTMAPTSLLVGSQEQVEDLNMPHRHHMHHAEMRGLAAPSPPNQALCQGHQRIPSQPPWCSSLPSSCRPRPPIWSSRRSRRVRMKGPRHHQLREEMKACSCHRLRKLFPVTSSSGGGGLR